MAVSVGDFMNLGTNSGVMNSRIKAMIKGVFNCEGHRFRFKMMKKL